METGAAEPERPAEERRAQDRVAKATFTSPPGDEERRTPRPRGREAAGSSGPAKPPAVIFQPPGESEPARPAGPGRVPADAPDARKTRAPRQPRKQACADDSLPGTPSSGQGPSAGTGADASGGTATGTDTEAAADGAASPVTGSSTSKPAKKTAASAKSAAGTDAPAASSSAEPPVTVAKKSARPKKASPAEGPTPAKSASPIKKPSSAAKTTPGQADVPEQSGEQPTSTRAKRTKTAKAAAAPESSTTSPPSASAKASDTRKAPAKRTSRPKKPTGRDSNASSVASDETPPTPATAEGQVPLGGSPTGNEPREASLDRDDPRLSTTFPGDVPAKTPHPAPRGAAPDSAPSPETPAEDPSAHEIPLAAGDASATQSRPPAGGPAVDEAPATPTRPDVTTPTNDQRQPLTYHLAAALVERLGPRADRWATDMRAAYPAAGPDALARLAQRRFARKAAVTGGLAGALAWWAPAPAAAWAHAELVVHIAAAYGRTATPDDLLAVAAPRAVAKAAAASAGLALAARAWPGAGVLGAAAMASIEADRVAARAVARFQSHVNQSSGSSA